ncbi:MAG TPA: PAS domain-containing protein [Alphaproteobacteria bacterium]|nr:PAS domain-containing protein [Alphaproteobacteria bacterium]
MFKTHYPRMFLPDCVERLGEGARLVYEYWNAKRGERFAPARTDLDWFDMAAWRAGIVIVEVKRYPDLLIYREVGQRAIDARGSDPTGKSVIAGYFGSTLADVLENYRLVIREHKAVYDFDHTPTENGREIEKETLLLPLSADGKTVDHVLIFLETGKRKVWW